MARGRPGSRLTIRRRLGDDCAERHRARRRHPAACRRYAPTGPWDRVRTYASHDFRAAFAARGMTASMTRKRTVGALPWPRVSSRPSNGSCSRTVTSRCAAWRRARWCRLLKTGIIANGCTPPSATCRTMHLGRTRLAVGEQHLTRVHYTGLGPDRTITGPIHLVQILPRPDCSSFVRRARLYQVLTH